MKTRALPVAALAIVCTILPLAGQIYGDRSSGWLLVDFRAYYCASSAQRVGADPYLTASIHQCEATTPAPFYRVPPNVTVPAPYPPYVLAAIAPLTYLPFAAAALIWLTIAGACCLLSGYLLARVTGQPFVAAWAALALSLTFTSLPSGQLVPVCVAALLSAALAVQRGYLSIAAIALGIATIEPHVALPAAVAFAVRYPSKRTSAVLALTFALIAMGSLAAAGAIVNVEYLRSVLPAHALSEVSRDNQYSLSTVLAALGVADRTAVFAGGLSYVVMLVAGVVAALRLAHQYLESAFVVLVPPALALLGGSFVHTVELAAAIPACLLLLTRTNEHRKLALTALILLAVPWMSATSAALFLAPLFPVAYLVYAFCGGRLRLTLLAGAASMAFILLLFDLAAHSTGHVPVHAAHPFIDPRLAEAAWRSLVLDNSTNRPVTWLLRLPTWIGLIAFAAAALRPIPKRDVTRAAISNA